MTEAKRSKPATQYKVEAAVIELLADENLGEKTAQWLHDNHKVSGKALSKAIWEAALSALTDYEWLRPLAVKREIKSARITAPRLGCTESEAFRLWSVRRSLWRMVPGAVVNFEGVIVHRSQTTPLRTWTLDRPENHKSGGGLTDLQVMAELFQRGVL